MPQFQFFSVQSLESCCSVGDKGQINAHYGDTEDTEFQISCTTQGTAPVIIFHPNLTARVALMTAIHKVRLTILLLLSALALSSCAALQPLSATGPRGNEPAYPILLLEDSHRREAMIVALNRLSQRSGNSSAIEVQPQLQPITATILSLPPRASGNFFLPKVGGSAVMNEEETRESLRRFINQSQELIGADPSDLSLVERIDQPDGTKLANYEQRPFRYPIRGSYGKLQIRFLSDRRIVDLTSTCIPDADRIGRPSPPLARDPEPRRLAKHQPKGSGLHRRPGKQSGLPASHNRQHNSPGPGGLYSPVKR